MADSPLLPDDERDPSRERHLFTYYDPLDGRIVGSIDSILSDVLLNAEGMLAYVGEYHPDQFYFLDNLPTPRPAPLTCTLVGNELRFDLPVEVQIRIRNSDDEALEAPIQQGEVTLTPGNYRWLIIPPFPYARASGEVEVL